MIGCKWQFYKCECLQVSTAQEVTLGLKDFFNAVVGDKLLYKIERLQYSEQGAVGGDPIDVYGSAHLLRLMAKINGLLNRNRQDEQGAKYKPELLL